MNWIAILTAVLTVVLRVVLPALLKRGRPSVENADARRALRRRLREKVLQTWGKAGAVLLLAAILWGTSGCQSPRTIYVPDGTPVRLRETIRKAKVWILDGDLKPVAGVMDLPEGWFCLSPPEVEAEGGVEE